MASPNSCTLSSAIAMWTPGPRLYPSPWSVLACLLELADGSADCGLDLDGQMTARRGGRPYKTHASVRTISNNGQNVRTRTDQSSPRVAASFPSYAITLLLLNLVHLLEHVEDSTSAPRLGVARVIAVSTTWSVSFFSLSALGLSNPPALVSSGIPLHGSLSICFDTLSNAWQMKWYVRLGSSLPSPARRSKLR